MILTQREVEVLSHVVSGKQNKEVALALNISHYTVERHLTKIYHKIDVANRTEAAIWFATVGKSTIDNGR